MNISPRRMKPSRSFSSYRRGPALVARNLTALLVWSGMARSYAGPAGMTVGHGQASVSGSDQHRVIQVSDRALLNWQSFNIGANESLKFLQPSASSVVWNKISDPNPSSIFGRLEANGIVVLQNSSGFYFGPNSFVSAGGLFVTTSPSLPPDFASGGSWIFNGPPPTASIVNYGELRTHSGGSMFLVAERIENHGTLAAPGGKIGLLAGQEVLVSERPDGRGLSAEVRLPSGVVDNQGRILADAGEIALHARVVNQSGTIEANSVRERNGVIELVASDAVNLGAESRIEARGQNDEAATGGRIEIKSDRAFTDASGSKLDVSGGGLGGNGGFVEVSAKQMPAIRSTLIGKAQSGWRGGELLIDPTDIIIGSEPGGTLNNGTVGSGDLPETLRLDVNSSFLGFARITLDATRDITLANGTLWNLNESTGVSDPGCLLTLHAGRNITLQSGASLFAGENWSMDLTAGADFSNGGAPLSGVGSILLQGTAGIQAHDGSVTLRAGQDVTVGTGFVHTIGGGDIAVTALAGTVNTGTRIDGFRFTTTGIGYEANTTTLGGISTAAGGDVSITAGKDIISYFPSGSGSHSDGGSGAFGAEAGDVTLSAGRDVVGHYVVRNGEGHITSGRDAGTQISQLALSLVKGSWDVNAGRDIFLQEVRNPNGIFNNRGFSGVLTRHLFDYDLAASVSLKAANSVQLLGVSLPRNQSETLPAIYAPSLSIEAGAGGVVFGNNLYLFPSPSGQLEITTTQGGSVRTTQAGRVFEVVMSDSSRVRYTGPGNFGAFDPERTLLHQNDGTPARLEISGSVRDLLVSVPKPVEMRVEGDVINTSLLAQHFNASAVSRLVVGGDIFNRVNWTFSTLTAAPDLQALENAVVPVGSQISLDGLRAKFVYNPETRRFGFQGRMTGAEQAFLLNLKVKTFDVFGQPIRDDAGEFVTASGTVASEAVVRDLFSRSQDIPNQAAKGYQVSGPGLFEISARNVDLGITEGIVSHGAGLNRLLGPLSPRGVDIDINLRGNLSMFSSSIQSRAGGNIFVRADGAIDVGSQEISGTSEVARGIYTGREGDVTVIAKGNINVNGSRIAAYSGGNVFVKSLEGDVNAGAGGVGFVRVSRVLVDPLTGEVTIRTRGIPGSGILATTFPGTPGTVGNITVETPKGDILAGQGGIAQLSFNGTPNRTGLVKLSAGTPPGEGQPEIVGNIIAGNSGVIGGNVKLNATGDIEGVVVAQGNLDIESTRDVNVTALAGGNATINASGTVSGIVVAAGGLDASGASIDASLFSANVNATSGTGSVPTADTGTGPTAAAQAAAATTDKEAQGKEEEKDDDKKKKKGGLPTLARSQGRVTVILPGR